MKFSLSALAAFSLLSLCAGQSLAQTTTPVYGWVGYDTKTNQLVNKSSGVDNTGLDVEEIHKLSANGAPIPKTYKHYANIGEGNHDLDITINNPITYPTRLPFYSLRFSGTSELTWKWVLPPEFNNARYQGKFQMPPLFAIAVLEPYFDFSDWSNGEGLNANLVFNTGVGPDWAWSTNQMYSDGYPIHFQGFYVGGPGDSTLNRRIFKKPQPASGSVLNDNSPSNSFSLSPSLTFEASATSPVGTGIYKFTFIETISALMMDVVDPNPANPTTNTFGCPELGDGRNQMVYDLNGLVSLMVKVHADEIGGESDVRRFLTPRVSWTVFPALPNQAVFETRAVNNNTAVAPVTPVTGTTQTLNGIIGNGMPLLNSDFGDRTVTLLVKAVGSSVFQPGQIAYFQTFFPSTLSTHPPSATPPPVQEVGANWYFYYRQIMLNDNNSYLPFYKSSQRYNPAPTPPPDNYKSYYSYADGLIHLGDDAHGFGSHRMFVIPDSGGEIQLVGSLETRGIHTFLSVAGHEAGHRYYATHYYTHNGVNVVIDSGPGSLPESEDYDQDGLRDDWESAHHLNPKNPDTTDAYKGDTSDLSYGDAQLLADVYAWGALGALQNSADPYSDYVYKGAWRQDWADDGLQFHRATGPGRRGRPYEPWQFRPEVPDPQPPPDGPPADPPLYVLKGVLLP